MIVFVCPDPATFPSGGNRYNELLMRGLKCLGVAFRQMEYAAWESAHLNDGDILLFDSLYFDQLAALSGFFERPGKKYFLLHYLASFYPRDEDLLKWQLQVLKGFDGIICPGEAVLEELVALGVASALHFLPPAEERPLLPAPKPKEKSGLAVLWVASMQPVKGVLEMLEALEREAGSLCARGVEVRLVGTGEVGNAYADACRALLSKGALRAVVRYSGPLPHAVLQQNYAEADVLLSASHFETFGMAVREACLWGIPVLAREAAYLRWHKQRGEVYTFSELQYLAKALVDFKPERRRASTEDLFSCERAASKLLRVILGL